MTALLSVMLLILNGFDALSRVADALTEFTQIEFLNILRLLSGDVSTLMGRRDWSVELAHVDTLIQEVLSTKLLIVDWRVGCLSRC